MRECKGRALTSERWWYVRSLLLPLGDRRMRGLGIICSLHRCMHPSFPLSLLAPGKSAHAYERAAHARERVARESCAREGIAVSMLMLAMVEDTRMLLSDSIRPILSLAVALSHPFSPLSTSLGRSIILSHTRNDTLCDCAGGGFVGCVNSESRRCPHSTSA